MPRHAFKFPPQVSEAVRQHVRAAIANVNPQRYQQEPTYTTALISRLDGVAYKGKYGSVVFRGTVFNDRARGSAESRYGADFAITATVSNSSQTIEKAILVQAKLNRLDELGKRDIDFLKSQLKKMKVLVNAPKVMEIPREGDLRHPRIISGNRVLAGESYRPVNLDRYFSSRVITTLDGGTERDLVAAVQDSSLSQIDVKASLDYT